MDTRESIARAETELALLKEEMAEAQREIAPKYQAMNFNQVDDFLRTRVAPLRKKIATAQATLTRLRRSAGAP